MFQFLVHFVRRQDRRDAPVVPAKIDQGREARCNRGRDERFSAFENILLETHGSLRVCCA